MKKIYLLLVFILSVIVTSKYAVVSYSMHDFYLEKYNKYSKKIVYGRNAPRGRILDRNGKVLVDNVGVQNIVYSGNDLGIVESLVDYYNIGEATDDECMDYYLNNEDIIGLLTENEKNEYNNRSISYGDVKNVARSRVKLTYDKRDRKKIKLFNAFNKGYKYSPKVIESDVDDKVCALVNSLNFKGFNCEYGVKRVYLYDTMNAIYGRIGEISAENKKYYLSKGYSLDDVIGISYLEKEYDKYLRGKRAKYMIDLNSNKKTLVEKEEVGNDIILTIDIDLQLKINDIIKNNIKLSHSLNNTMYYDGSYVIVSDPNTGEILASTGLMEINDEYRDVTGNILTQSFTVGSVVKGASMSVGYINNLINKGEKVNDSCVKLYQVPTKCSYKKLGWIDDITALKTSSNYYQFLLAIKSTGNKYKYNMKLNVNEGNFNLYRDIFNRFGLGSSTGIDLENESIGIKGKTIAPDLLLNLSIGQYDTYTPLQLTSYINTIATRGERYKLHYLDSVKNDGEEIYKYTPEVVDRISGNDFDRIIEGFKEVLYIGTGRGYTDIKYKPAGKTGTSEVVYSKDVTTINQTYIMFAPYDNPKYSIVVLSPNISYNNEKNNYIAPINRYISKQVSELVFE